MEKHSIDFVAPIFRDEDHSYTLDGRPIPGFTEIAQAEGLIKFSGIPKDVLDYAAERGRAAHLGCHYLDQEALDWKSVHHEVEGYIRGYEKFKKETGFVVFLSEQPMASRTFWFACTPDKIGQLNGENTVIDLKTGAPASWHGIQLSAQTLCLPDGFKRAGLYLTKEGGYRIKPYSDRGDFNAWISAVSLHHWKSNNA